jgi:pilus assembly protein FimV
MLLLLAPALAFALSVGPLQVKSHLYQPLQAKLLISDLQKIPTDEIKVGLASGKEFARANMVRSHLINSLRFKSQNTAEGLLVNISSAAPVSEPYVNFLLHVSWPEGEYIKSYVALLNPAPTIAPKPVPVMHTKLIKPVQREYAVSQQPQSRVYGPTKRTDNLWEVAKAVRPNKSVSINQTMIALAQYNAQAFRKHNINGLMSGFYLRVPTEQQIKAINQSSAWQKTKNHNQAWVKGQHVKLQIKKWSKPVAVPMLKPATPVVTPVGAAQTQAMPTAALMPANTSAKAPAIVDSTLVAKVSSLLMSNTELKTQNKQLSNVNSLLDVANAKLKVEVAKLSSMEAALQAELVKSQGAVKRLQQLIKQQVTLSLKKAKQENAVVDILTQHWWMLIALLIVVLLLVWLVIYHRSRNQQSYTRKSTTKDEDAQTDVDADLEDESLDIDVDRQPNERKTHIEHQAAGEDLDALDMSDVLPDMTVQEMRRKNPKLSDDTASVNDLLAEAKLYVDYGRLDQAQEMLNKTVTMLPNEISLWDELLHIAADIRDRVYFGAIVAKIPAELLTEGDKGLWHTVEALRENLPIEVTPSAEAKAPKNDDAEQSQVAGETGIPMLTPMSAEEAELEEPVIAQEPDTTTLTPLADNDDASFTLADEEAAPTVEAPEQTVEKNALDFSFKLSDMDEEKVHADVVGEDSEQAELDLICAYVEMSDYKAAKKSLKKLIATARADIKVQAEKMLEDLQSK